MRIAPISAACLALATAGLALAAQERDRSQAWEALRRRFDADFDGRVSAEEYPRSRQVFRRLDRDRDGYLTAKDFAAAPAKEGAGGKDAPVATPSATPEQIEFFESRIRPVLAGACFECHSERAAKLKGGLKLDSSASMLAGGTSGPVVVPGDPDASLLVQAIRYADEDLQMPPKQRLEPDVVRDIERWVQMGAAWPGASTATTTSTSAPDEHPIDWDEARRFWAFQPPRKSAAPATKDTKWAWSDIDRFLLAAMEARGVAPVEDADRRTWLRRVTFDLTGLPPAPEETAAFLADKSAAAHEKVVDRLLATRAFGERWGRHWLDVARYAESSGKDSNVLYPHAWRYRDWVIDAFARDLRYDEFLTAQLAGDLLPARDDDQRAAQAIATGYLALGAKGHATRDRRQFALDVADEQIDAVSQGMLGLTVACARCHDHKFDPIGAQDYYALAGIFLSSETRYGTARGPGNLHPAELVALPAGAHVPNGPTMPASVRRQLERARAVAERAAGGSAERARAPATGDEPRPADGIDLVRARYARETQAQLDDLLARFDEQGRALPSNRLAMGVVEGKPRDIAVLERGEIDRPGAIAPRGFPRVLAQATGANLPENQAKLRGSGRLELAQWIASADNPLTARVWVNRVWLHLFGRGIVATPDNFGASGQRPDHPELLDWLAVTFVEDGWSTKALVRRIVLSRAYRLASSDDARGVERDPEHVTRWRTSDRRLEAEAIRDAMLVASGALQAEPPVGSPVGVLEGTTRREELLAPIVEDRPVRSVYLPVLRDHLPDALDVFDAADPAFVTGDREETNVATQALYLLNDPDVMRWADAFAARLLARSGDDDARIALAFELALARAPSGSELEGVRKFLREAQRAPASGSDARAGGSAGARRDRRGSARDGGGDPRLEAWSAFCQTLFACAEFRHAG